MGNFKTVLNGKLILIILLAVLLRLGTLPELLSFTPDEAYQTYIAQTLIKNFHVIWIGMSAGSFDLYYGPFWIYIIYPLLFLARGDPIVLGYIASSLGVLAVILLYILGKKLFNKNVGLIASLLYACLPLIVYYDQKPYPSGIPFLSLLIFLSLYMLRYSGWWLVLFSIAYGMVFHIHLSLMPVIFVAMYWAILHRELISKKIFLLSVLAFVIMVSPLIAFDYFHKASNITTPIRVIKSAQKGEVNPATTYHLNSLVESFGRVFYLEPYKNSTDEILYSCTKTSLSTRTKPHWLISGVAITLFAYFALRKSSWKDKKKILLLLLSFSILAPFIFLPIINPLEYYLLGFFPLLFLIIASLVESGKNPFKAGAYLSILIIASLGVFTVLTTKGDYGINTKKKLISQVMAVIGNKPYDLWEEGDCHKYGGWRYLFSVYGRRPERSSEDATFAWLYPDEISTKDTRYSVVVKETRVPVIIDKGYKFTFQEGGFTAFVYER